MSKKFKGKKCAYCAERESVTGDHIFAREFFLVAERAEVAAGTAQRNSGSICRRGKPKAFRSRDIPASNGSRAETRIWSA